KDLAVEHADAAAGQALEVDAAALELRDILDRHAVDVLHYQHPLGGELPVDGRNVEVARALKVAFEQRSTGRLGLHVELAVDDPLELRDDIVGAIPVPFRMVAAQQARECTQQFQVAPDLAFDSRSHHLDHDLLAGLQAGSVDLRDRGRGQRAVIELVEQLGNRGAKLAFYDGARLFGREG